MSLVDEQGRLLGRVNVYDAAVVVLLLVGIGAGAVVVLDPFAPEGSEETVTRYVTLDFGEQSPATAARVSAGDTDGGLTVTDTYVGPAGGENVTLFARVRVEGQPAGDRFEYAGYPISPGVALDVETEAYDVGGEVVALDTENGSLATARTPVLVETALSSATALPVERNDTYRLGNRTVGTVTGVVAEPATGGGNRSALVALSLATVGDGGETYFGETRLLAGRSVAFRTDDYALSGRAVRVGDASLATGNRSVTVELRGVDPAVADDFEAGLVERSGGTTTARLTGVTTEPTPVVGVGGNGTAVEADHPRLLDVTLTVDVRVRETEDGLRFRTRPLRAGTELLLDFDTVVADGTVTAVRN